MIDKRTLETILSDQQEELASRAQETLCHRREESQIDMNSTQAQVVIGVRRSGKSTLCYQAIQSSGCTYAYVDFDDERLVDIDANQLNDVLEVLYKIYGDFSCIFLDEVQNVEGWHLFVNRLLRRKMHVVITGSNAKLFSGELATHLSGRSKEISLYPFSFSEYCRIKNVDIKSRTTKAEAFRQKAFDDYMRQGGFPELLTIEDNKSYVGALVDNILKRDIEQRYKIAYKASFEQLAQHLLNVVPCPIVIKDLAQTFGIKSDNTVKNYVKYLEEAYLLIGIQKYSPKSRLRVVQEKVYAVDVAMMDKRDNAFAGDNLGYRLETVVAIHLIRSSKMNGLDVYYLSDRSGECDFIVCKGNRVVQAIQVSYDISSEKTRKREIKGLLLAARQTGCDNLLLLTDHENAEIEESGYQIKIQTVCEWSLELEDATYIANNAHNIATVVPKDASNIATTDHNIATAAPDDTANIATDVLCDAIYIATSNLNIASDHLSENKRTVDDQVRAKVKPRMSKELIRESIVEACVVEHSVDELSALLNKTPNYLRNFIIPDMIAEGILLRTKPEHSRGQTYITAHNPDE